MDSAKIIRKLEKYPIEEYYNFYAIYPLFGSNVSSFSTSVSGFSVSITKLFLPCRKQIYDFNYRRVLWNDKRKKQKKLFDKLNKKTDFLSNYTVKDAKRIRRNFLVLNMERETSLVSADHKSALFIFVKTKISIHS